MRQSPVDLLENIGERRGLKGGVAVKSKLKRKNLNFAESELLTLLIG